MGGKSVSNRISTTLPRTATTAPRFEGLAVFFMFALAGPRPVELRRTSSSIVLLLRSRLAPLPVADLGHVFAVLVDVQLVIDELVLELLLQVDALVAGPRHAIDGVHHAVSYTHLTLPTKRI